MGVTMSKLKKLFALLFAFSTLAAISTANVGNVFRKDEAKIVVAANNITSGVDDGTGSVPINSKIYLCVISDWISAWGSGVTFNNTWVKRNGDENTERQLGAANCTYARVSAKTKKIGNVNYPLVEVDITANTSSVVWSCKSSGGSNNYSININPTFYSRGGLVNTYVVSSNYSGDTQRGFWTYLDDATTIDGSSDLYFSPSYYWGNKYWQYQQLWPYLIIRNDSNKIIYECAATNIVENVTMPTRTRETTDLSHYIFRFINVPVSGARYMYMYHSWRAYYNASDDYAQIDSTNWTNGTNNFFGTIDKDNEAWVGGGPISSSNVFGTFFYDNPAKAFIRGLFKKYPGISESMSTGTNPATSSAMGGIILPVEEYSFTKRGEDLYRLSLSVDVNDSFTYHTYDYLKNKYSSGKASSWQYNTFGEYDYDNLSHISVYDERISTESVVADASEYIGVLAARADGSRPIYFKKAGFVELRRTSNTVSNDYLQIRYKDKFAMVGSGSFVDRYEWSTAGGVELEDDADNIGKLTNIFLKENDIFQLTNNTHWCDWYDFKSGDKTTYFDSTILDKVGSDAKFKATIQLEEVGDTWWNSGSETHVVVTCSNSSHNREYTLASATGEVEIYNDVTGIVIKRVDASDHTTVWHTANINTGRSGSIALNNRNTGYKMFLKIWTWGNEWGDNCDYAIYNSNTDENRGDNIRVKKTGYYNLWLNNSFEIYISAITEFEEKDAVYLDFNGKWPFGTDYGALYGALFVNSNDDSLVVELNDVHGRGGDTRVIKEAPVPKVEGSNPNKVLWLRLDPTGYVDKPGEGWSVRLPYDDNKWHKVWNQTVDQSFNMGYNFFTMGDARGDGKFAISSTGYITNKERAEFYGTYFNAEVVCTGEGLDPSHHNWAGVKIEWNHMCGNAQAIIRKAEANSSGTQVEIAVSKYDDIVFRRKHVGYDDFMDRNASDGTSGSHYAGTLGAIDKLSPYSLFEQGDNATIILVIVFSSIAVLSVTTLAVLAIKKRKSE